MATDIVPQGPDTDSLINAIGCMTLPQLSPLLTLLDAFLGHRSPLATPVVSAELEMEICVLDLATMNAMFGRFLRSGWCALKPTLEQLGLVLCAVSSEEPKLRLVCGGAKLTFSQVHEMSRLIEVRLGQPEVVLNMLLPATKLVMKACIDFIEDCCSYIDAGELRKCVVRPSDFFGEDWSIGFETAWQASGAERILTMPNYKSWTEAHKSHRARSWRDSSGITDGRLWRFEYWECLRTPCHEVIHLVQHIMDQRMSVQVAEHDGAFSTYLLMLALDATAKIHAATRDSQNVSGSNTQLSLVECYFPGAAEEAVLESIDYSSRVHSGASHAEYWSDAHKANYERWRNSFGVCDMKDVWGSQRNFGGELKVESICKNMVALEAIAVDGSGAIQGHAEISLAANAMLATMFEGRTGVCDEVAVNIRPEVRLDGIHVGDRIKTLIAPMGITAAIALTEELSLLIA